MKLGKDYGIIALEAGIYDPSKKNNNMCVKPDNSHWAGYYFTCEVCGKPIEIKTDKDSEDYEEYDIDSDLIDDWENGMGAPACLKCLRKQRR